MVHKQDRLGFQGGSEWACPFCAHQVVYWGLHHKVMVTGQAEVLHVRAMTEVPVHLDDIVVELTEADEHWPTANTIAWSGGWPDEDRSTRGHQRGCSSACERWQLGRFIA